MDEAKRVLENSTVSAACLPTGYQKLSSSPSLVDSKIGQASSLLDPAPLEIWVQDSVPDQTLVKESVDLTPFVVHQVFSIEIQSNPPHVLLVSLDSSNLEKDSSIPIVQETAPPTPMMDIS